MDGLLIIDKPSNYTSRDVVNIVSKKLNTRKVGHTGTLDPLAMGVLVLCVGRATKLVEIFTNDDKEYIATIILGIKTETLDLEGEIIERKVANYSVQEITFALNDFLGEYNQEVPLYSAVRVGGKKLYEYARNNEEVNLPKRQVSIKDISLIGDVSNENDTTIFKIKVTVSKGTYIRSLVNDIAASLNTIGVMSELVRIRQGQFTKDLAISLEEVNKDTKLISITDSILNVKKIKVDNILEKDIKNGKILENIYNDDKILFINDKNEALAIYVKHNIITSKIKPWKMF